MSQMKSAPVVATVGVFTVGPQPGMMRDARVIQNKVNRAQDMEVQRADIPDLIEALTRAYYGSPEECDVG